MSRPLPRRWRRTALELALVLALVTAVQFWRTREVGVQPLPTEALTLLTAQGSATQMTLAQWRAAHPGRAIVLHFWAEWCPICRTEEHSISSLTQDTPVLTVAMQSGPVPQVQQVLLQRGLRWNTVVDPQGSLTRSFGFGAVPAFVIVDAAGRVRTPTLGYTSELGMRARLLWVRLTSAAPPGKPAHAPA